MIIRSNSLATFADVIEAWPEPPVSTFAQAISVSYNTAKAMRRRNSIPAEHWAAVVRGAQAIGRSDITFELLAEICRDRHAASGRHSKMVRGRSKVA